MPHGGVDINAAPCAYFLVSHRAAPIGGHMKVRDYPQIKCRLSPELKAQLIKASELSNRTLNSEACYQLEKAYGLKVKNQETT